MAVLGRNPWKDPESGITLRESETISLGMQAFWSVKNGMGLCVDWITAPHPELAGKFDTLVLNPQDYEAVKKSIMERPKRDRARKQAQRGMRDLQGIDFGKRFRDKMAQSQEARNGRD